MRGVAVNPRGAPTEGEADGDDEGNLRRGRRARRQVHPSLAEDKMAKVAFGDVESDNDASSEDENESPSDHRTGYGKEQGETSPPRFWKTAEPWGQGDIPRIKVSGALQQYVGSTKIGRRALVRTPAWGGGGGLQLSLFAL